MMRNLNEIEINYMITKYNKIQGKYYSHILNLESNSKKWKLASRALDKLNKTQSHKWWIDSVHNIF